MEKTGTNKRILIVIPCYNEAGNVVQLGSELSKLKIEGTTLVSLFINDHSSDNTRQVLQNENLNHLDNPINLGIGGTVQLGFRYAWENEFDIAVQMDGDGQHPPSELHRVLEPLLKNEVDVCIGSRFLDKAGFQSTILRRSGIYFFYWLNRFLVGVRVKDSTSGYRAYNRKAIEALTEYYPDEYPEPETVLYLTNKKLRIKEVAVTMHERQHGKSSIRSFSTVYYMFKVSLNTLFLHFKMKFHGDI